MHVIINLFWHSLNFCMGVCGKENFCYPFQGATVTKTDLKICQKSVTFATFCPIFRNLLEFYHRSDFKEILPSTRFLSIFCQSVAPSYTHTLPPSLPTAARAHSKTRECPHQLWSKVDMSAFFNERYWKKAMLVPLIEWMSRSLLDFSGFPLWVIVIMKMYINNDNKVVFIQISILLLSSMS